VVAFLAINLNNHPRVPAADSPPLLLDRKGAPLDGLTRLFALLLPPCGCTSRTLGSGQWCWCAMATPSEDFPGFNFCSNISLRYSLTCGCPTRTMGSGRQCLCAMATPSEDFSGLKNLTRTPIMSRKTHSNNISSDKKKNKKSHAFRLWLFSRHDLTHRLFYF